MTLTRLQRRLPEAQTGNEEITIHLDDGMMAARPKAEGGLYQGDKLVPVGSLETVAGSSGRGWSARSMDRSLAYRKRVDSDNWRVSGEAVRRRAASGNPRRQLTCRCGFAQRCFAGEK